MNVDKGVASWVVKPKMMIIIGEKNDPPPVPAELAKIVQNKVIRNPTISLVFNGSKALWSQTISSIPVSSFGFFTHICSESQSLDVLHFKSSWKKLIFLGKR